MLPSQLTPLNSHTVSQTRQLQQKQNFDKISKALLSLRPKDRVRYKCGSKWKPAIVVAKHVSPRSYMIKTTRGTSLKCNGKHLKKTLESTRRVWRTVKVKNVCYLQALLMITIVDLNNQFQCHIPDNLDAEGYKTSSVICIYIIVGF